MEPNSIKLILLLFKGDFIIYGKLLITKFMIIEFRKYFKGGDEF